MYFLVLSSKNLAMTISVHFLLYFLTLARVLGSIEGVTPLPYSMPFNRSSFPSTFIFGAGMAAYQTEGAANTDGRSPSIWDTFVKKFPGKIADNSTGDVAQDFYHRYKGDIKLMKKIGLDSFRFSISWSRVLPKGKISGGVNPLGVKFYNNLINELLLNGIQPFVTLYHWDLPQALEDEYGGWLSRKIVNDYKNYVDFCFKTFGDRVKHWVTMNEPNGVSSTGYNTGTMAPGRCSNYVGTCPAGNSATEPYIAGHNYLVAHATAVKLYRQKYQPYQKGKIGITCVTHWFEPMDNTTASHQAVERAIDFMFGWFVNAITYGEYPQTMRSYVGNRLPNFTESESKMLKGSYDFLGVNYYTTYYAQRSAVVNIVNQSYSTDPQNTLSGVKNGVPIGTLTALSWLYIYPKGIYDLMVYIKKKYNDPVIYITENGMADANNSSLPIKTAIKDSVRIRYHHGHLSYLLKAIKDGVKVKRYYLWAFFDDFEWDAGYTVRFGITYIDYANNLKRYLKYSAYWFKMFLLN